jgi:hypothetical protein
MDHDENTDANLLTGQGEESHGSLSGPVTTETVISADNTAGMFAKYSFSTYRNYWYHNKPNGNLVKVS